jgi:hypothetical protein
MEAYFEQEKKKMNTFTAATNSILPPTIAATKPDSIKKRFLKLAKSSSFHGVPNLLKSEHLFMRFVWFVCMMSSFGFCSYEIARSISKFLKFDVLITSELVRESNTEFPAVTFCNMNPINYAIPGATQQALKLLKESNFDDNIDDLSYNGTRDMYRLSMLAKEISYYINKKMNLSTYGYTFDNILIGCSFKGVKCEPEQITEFLSNDFGKCYTFNSGENAPTLSTNRPGMNNGLDLELFVGNSDRNPWLVSYLVS